MGRKKKDVDPSTYERIFFGTIYLRILGLTSEYMSDRYVPGWSSKILLGLSACYAKQDSEQPILDSIDNEFGMMIDGLEDGELDTLTKSRVLLKQKFSQVQDHPNYPKMKSWLVASIVSNFSTLERVLGSAADGVASKALARLGAIESFYAGLDADEAKKYFIYAHSKHDVNNDTN